MTRAAAGAGKGKATKGGRGEENADGITMARRAAMLLKQAADPTRLQVLLMLGEGERHVGAISGELTMSQPAVSHHLALLRHGGLIAPDRRGKNNFYRLTESGAKL